MAEVRPGAFTSWQLPQSALRLLSTAEGEGAGIGATTANAKRLLVTAEPSTRATAEGKVLVVRMELMELAVKMMLLMPIVLAELPARTVLPAWLMTLTALVVITFYLAEGAFNRSAP